VSWVQTAVGVAILLVFAVVGGSLTSAHADPLEPSPAPGDEALPHPATMCGRAVLGFDARIERGYSGRRS
jgi:hypothetical protein